MASGEAKLKATASLDTRNFEAGAKTMRRAGVNAADEITKKNLSLIKSYVSMLSPIAIAFAAVTAAVRRIKKSYQELVDEGKKLSDGAEKIGASKYQFAALKSAADSAKVSVSDFNKSLDELKSGKVTIEQLTEAWKENADAADLAANRARTASALAAQIKAEREENEVGFFRGIAQGISRWKNGEDYVAAIAQMQASEGGAKMTARELAASANQEAFGEGWMRDPDAISVDKAQKILDEILNEQRSRKEDSDKKERNRLATEFNSYVSAAGGDKDIAYSSYTKNGGKVTKEQFNELLDIFDSEIKPLSEKIKESIRAEIEARKEIEAMQKEAARESAREIEEHEKLTEEERRKRVSMMKELVDMVGGDIDKAIKLMYETGRVTETKEREFRDAFNDILITDEEAFKKRFKQFQDEEKKAEEGEKRANQIADRIREIKVSLPNVSFGLNSAGGDISGFNGRAQLALFEARAEREEQERLIKSAEESKEILSRVREILEGDSE